MPEGVLIHQTKKVVEVQKYQQQNTVKVPKLNKVIMQNDLRFVLYIKYAISLSQMFPTRSKLEKTTSSVKVMVCFIQSHICSGCNFQGNTGNR